MTETAAILSREDAYRRLSAFQWGEVDEYDVEEWLDMEEPPVAETHETIEDFEAAGWQRDDRFLDSDGVIVLFKRRPNPSKPGRHLRTDLTVVDAGDRRYVMQG